MHRGELPHSEHVAIVALYDPASGEILHWHYCSADDASELPTPHVLESEALDHAMRHAAEEKRKKLSEASFLHVDRQNLKSRGPFKVDMQTRGLVELNPA